MRPARVRFNTLYFQAFSNPNIWNSRVVVPA